jgi:hypothetical protein
VITADDRTGSSPRANVGDGAHIVA